MANTLLPADYDALITDLKAHIGQARVRAALSVNRELVQLYWQIGKAILGRRAEASWGDKVLERLSKDLRHEFPEIKGFSKTNLKYMRRFAETYPDLGQQPVDQLPWGHNIVLMTKLKDADIRAWYTRATLQYGWSRSILEMQIETRLHERQGNVITNFADTLPAPQSDLAQQTLKDPYNFDFLGLHDKAVEREIEHALIEHLKRFMLELGVGFAFIGNQYHLEVGGDDFYIDMLFYHVHLHCYIVIELKARDFRPTDAGQLNFYLNAVDNILCQPEDNPTVGLLLCKSKNNVVAEYALKGLSSPLGVSEYRLVEALPKDLEGTLPSIEDLEAELENLEMDET